MLTPLRRVDLDCARAIPRDGRTWLNTWVISCCDLASLDSAAKDERILAQAETIALSQRQVEVLTQQAETLTRRVAELEAKLGLPPKTPDNSSLPSSQRHKTKGEPLSKPKGKPHKGVARALHESPTRTLDAMTAECPHCMADVSQMPQMALHRYDRIELPEIKPNVTRVVLPGGRIDCLGAQCLSRRGHHASTGGRLVLVEIPRGRHAK